VAITFLTYSSYTSGFAKVVVERCSFHHWLAQRISWGEVVSVFSLPVIVSEL